jgi:hypothetical protein
MSSGSNGAPSLLCTPRTMTSQMQTCMQYDDRSQFYFDQEDFLASGRAMRTLQSARGFLGHHKQRHVPHTHLLPHCTRSPSSSRAHYPCCSPSDALQGGGSRQGLKHAYETLYSQKVDCAWYHDFVAHLVIQTPPPHPPPQSFRGHHICRSKTELVWCKGLSYKRTGGTCLTYHAPQYCPGVALIHLRCHACAPPLTLPVTSEYQKSLKSRLSTQGTGLKVSSVPSMSSSQHHP